MRSTVLYHLDMFCYSYWSIIDNVIDRGANYHSFLLIANLGVKDEKKF